MLHLQAKVDEQLHEIQQLDLDVVGLKQKLAVALQTTAEYYRKYIRPFVNLGDELRSVAKANYGKFDWFRALNSSERVKWGLGPLPSDYGKRHWHERGSDTDGYPLYRLLFGVPGWDNDEGHGPLQTPRVDWPCWAYVTYDPDPPNPQSARTGVAENLILGSYPVSWGMQLAAKGAVSFFKRFGRLVEAFLGVLADAPLPPSIDGEPITHLATDA